MLSGDNGILQRATDAKTDTDNAQIKERIQLAYHSALLDGQGKVTEPSLESEIKNEFNKTTLNEGWLDKTSKTGKWIVTIDNVSLEVPAGEEVDNKIMIKVGTTSLKEVSDLTTVYGETTDYISVEGVQWQLFFSDTNNIYLIANDYVPGDTLPTELITNEQYTTYCRYFAYYENSTYPGTIMENTPWSNGAESSTITENTQTNTYLKWVNSTLATTKNNPNMKAVAYMMDTRKWFHFAGTATGAYAIGGPTLEMFTLSYNAKHSTNQLGIYNAIDSSNANENGYKVKIGTKNWDCYASGLDRNSDNMWVKKSTDKAIEYWLASPCSGGPEWLYFVDCDGGITSDNVCNTLIGFRPLITIPKSSLK